MSQAEIDEALTDFDKFASLVEIVTKKNERIRFKPNRVQQKYLSSRSVRDVILKARQQGFTTIEQIRDLFYFLTVPGARVVVVCQSVTGQGPLKELSERFRIMLESLQRIGMKLNFTTEATGEWVLADRHSSLKIIVAGASEASASKKGRAGTISRLHVTECAFYEYADDTLNALLECVPDRSMGSEIVIESTANGAAGFFYRLCKAAATGGGSFKHHFFPWYETEEYQASIEPGEVIEPVNDRERTLVAKGVTPGQLKWIRAKIADKGQAKTDQEYPSDSETCFLVSGRAFFDQVVTSRLLEQATDPIERRDRDRISIWQKPVADKNYLLALDTSEGGGGDPSGGILRDRETGEHIATMLGQYTPWELAEAAAKLAREYKIAEIAVERNNHGHAVLQALQREHKYPKIYKHDDDKLGWPTNAVTRPTTLDALENAHRSGLWKSKDRNVLGQMRTFVVTDTGKAEAARGEHDDLVMAEAICWAVRAKPVFRYGAAPEGLANY